MIVNQPTLEIKGKKTTINTTAITAKGKKFTLWVSVDSKWNSFLATDSTPFTSALLLPSAKKGETLQVTGTVSTKWMQGAREIIDRVVGWQTGFSPINIKANGVKDTPAMKNVGVFFSGGVDSFSSYLKYKNSKRLKITHLLFVHGFDIDIKNKELADSVIKKMRQIAKKEKVALIEISTNVREVLDQMLRWDLSHGGALAMVALMLRKGFSSIIIPGSGNVEPQEPWGSCEYVDVRWSTESLKIVHDLDRRTRMDKVKEFVAKSDIALKYLRVCWRNTAYNCGVCDKCMETMIDLRINNVLHRSQSFPFELDLTKVSKIYSTPYYYQPYLLQNVEYLTKTGQDPELLSALQTSLHSSLNPSLRRRAIDYIHHLDFTYNESRLFVLLAKLQRNNHLKQFISTIQIIAHASKVVINKRKQGIIELLPRSLASSHVK